MKKKIAILGSTGSIGKSLLDIISKDINNFEIVLLTANKDHRTLIKQAKKFKVKNLILRNFDSSRIAQKKFHKQNVKVFNSFEDINKIIKKKLDYVMSSIVGVEGLDPTLKIIKFTKNIAIANKESIICGWNLIENELNKNNTKFIPVDSEHFSLWYGLKNTNIKTIENIYLTASGGPFNKIPIKNFKNIKVKTALKHPNWKMGKKISIDSATMINKVYEVIEAKKIFHISYKKIKILIHPKSYAHCLLKFQNGMIKIIAHDTTMKIPIFNTLYYDSDNKIKSKDVDIKNLNNLNFSQVDYKRYPLVNILKFLTEKNSLYETVIVSTNDTLVKLFLDKKIKFLDISKLMFKFISSKEFLKYKNISPKTVKDIVELNNYVRLNILKNVYKFTDVKKTN
tara:strand:- start:769 stop:1959 length:1191 start_codon:yes stop_codon:yes gene_type:complete